MIVSLKEMLQEANRGRYAVGAFNCLSLENVEGAIAAAEELNAPIIIQLAEVQFPCAPLNLMDHFTLRLLARLRCQWLFTSTTARASRPALRLSAWDLAQ